MRLYKVTGARPVHDAEPGSEAALDLTAEEEASLLQQGRLALVEREYVNKGTRVVYGAKPGKRFKAALTFGQESALKASGAIDGPEPHKAASAATNVKPKN